MTPDQDDDHTGFAIWYLRTKPVFPDSEGDLYGMKNNYNGLGIFVSKI